MPRVKGKVLKSGTKDGNLLCLIQVNELIPKSGEIVTLKWGSVRTLPQNSLYWVFLNWLINEAGLKNQGHFFAEELHGNLKKHLLQQAKGKNEEETTTDLTKSEFSEYFDSVDKFVQEFFGVDTAPFWEEYRKNFAEVK